MQKGNLIVKGAVGMPASWRCHFVCYLWRGKTRRSTGQKVGSLAKREGTAVGRRASGTQEERSAAAEQDYPENERHSRSEIGRVSAQEPAADRKSPPSMQEVFGPGGLLER